MSFNIGDKVKIKSHFSILAGRTGIIVGFPPPKQIAEVQVKVDNYNYILIPYHTLLLSDIELISSTEPIFKEGERVEIFGWFSSVKFGKILRRNIINHDFYIIRLDDYSYQVFDDGHAVPANNLRLVNKTINNNSVSNNSNITINDHVCPTCKNNRCSKTEKTCWRCGNPL